MVTNTLSIGELAHATRTKVETIRYYERIGLLRRCPHGRQLPGLCPASP